MIRVEINAEKFWQLAKMQPVHMNVSVIKTLIDAGIPATGDIGLRGVSHGKLTMFKERTMYVYEWEPGPDSPTSSIKSRHVVIGGPADDDDF